jgi:hypothetical protein
MGKTVDEHLKRMNPTGINWDDMTEEQRLELRMVWDAVVSDRKNLYCSCPRTSCRNNHNCQFCVALHRYYDSFSDCFRLIEEKLQEGVPPEKQFSTSYKMQADGNENIVVDPADPDGSRQRVLASKTPEQMRQVVERWNAIASDPENRKCSCPHTDCWYHGNCVKCVALHRHYGGFTYCTRYIVDMIDDAVEAYEQSK